MVESRSIVSGADRSTGPAPAAHCRANNSRETASSWRTLCHRKSRSQVPIVDGARDRSNNCGNAPTRSNAVSSMLSPPASIAPITVIALMPLFAPCRPSVSRPSTTPATSRRWASAAAGNSPAHGTKFGSSKLTDTPARS
jgi:hypothetical protein